MEEVVTVYQSFNPNILIFALLHSDNSTTQCPFVTYAYTVTVKHAAYSTRLKCTSRTQNLEGASKEDKGGGFSFRRLQIKLCE